MSDKNQTSSKHQKLSGEKKKQKSGWISRSSGKKKQKDTTIVYTRRPNETYEEYLETLGETLEETTEETQETIEEQENKLRDKGGFIKR